MNEVNAGAWYSGKTLLSGLLQKRSISFLSAVYSSFKLKCDHMCSESTLAKLCKITSCHKNPIWHFTSANSDAKHHESRWDSVSGVMIVKIMVGLRSILIFGSGRTSSLWNFWFGLLSWSCVFPVQAQSIDRFVSTYQQNLKKKKEVEWKKLRMQPCQEKCIYKNKRETYIRILHFPLHWWGNISFWFKDKDSISTCTVYVPISFWLQILLHLKSNKSTPKYSVLSDYRTTIHDDINKQQEMPRPDDKNTDGACEMPQPRRSLKWIQKMISCPKKSEVCHYNVPNAMPSSSLRKPSICSSAWNFRIDILKWANRKKQAK